MNIQELETLKEEAREISRQNQNRRSLIAKNKKRIETLQDELDLHKWHNQELYRQIENAQEKYNQIGQIIRNTKA